MNAVSRAMVVLAHADTEGWGGVGNDYIVDVGGGSAQRLRGEAGADWLEDAVGTAKISKSQSPQYGGKDAANDHVWRRIA